MKKKPLITINGKPCSGKGTVGVMLSEKLGVTHYSIGDIFRKLAKAKGMTLVEYLEYGETHPSVDRAPDQWAARKAKNTGCGIYDGRMMFHVIPNSVKIFLECSLKESARRLITDTHHKRKHEAELGSMSKAMTAIKRRIKTDTKRYKKYYGVDFYDHKHYDLVVNTTNITPKQVLQKILSYLRKNNLS